MHTGLQVLKSVCLLILAALALTSCKSKESAGTEVAKKKSTRPGNIPDWFPIYPGGKIVKVESHNNGPMESVQRFTISNIAADCVKATDWYDEKLKLAGFTVVKYAGYTNGYCSSNLNADGPGNVHGIRMSGDGGNPSSLNVDAVTRDMPGAGPQGAGKAPAWLPQYPGSAPANFVATDSGPEHRIEFNFTTADDAPKIIGWYNQQLRGAGFDIASAGAPDLDYGRLSASKAASIVSIRVEPAGGKRAVFIETRDGVQ